MSPSTASERLAQVERFRQKHHTELITLLFLDIAGSTHLKQALGDATAVELIQRHHALVRDLLRGFAGSEEIETAGDSFFVAFAKPSDAVKFALLLQKRLAAFGHAPEELHDRVGIHVGEVLIEEGSAGSDHAKALHGIEVDICARVMSLAQPGQILLTRLAFDAARQALRGQDLGATGPLEWLNHGPYLLKGVDEPLEIAEVGVAGLAPLSPPTSSEKAQRYVSPAVEPVLGWRPALGQAVPNTKWVLERKLGEGGFGEVWLGRHETLKEQRVFKFCFRAERVRTLKREVTLFRLLKERVGEHPSIVRLLEVYFDEPPYYLEMEYVEGSDLRTWCGEFQGVDRVPLEVRLEIVAQVADALQAAHEAGVIHRDVKPGNILVGPPAAALLGGETGRAAHHAVVGGESASSDRPWSIRAKLTDFGIGQLVSQESLAGLTRAGFTRTLSSTASTPGGTQLYMAPELVAGKAASIRSDIYSLGVVLYQ
jgi:serine/threonine-protein kinase